MIKLKKIKIQNFKGCKDRELEFGSVTNVYGENAKGKTTIFDAFCWLLFNKDSHGIEKFDIRPLDADGNRIDNVEIMVEACLEIDGNEVILKKTQKQNWVKKRGSEVSELQGNVNEFEVDGFPKAEKVYKEYISELIDESLFKLITSPQTFTAMKWKEQRDILLKLVSEVTDQDVIEVDVKFEELRELLSKGTVEDLTAKTQKALKELKKKQLELPARIDEAAKAIVQVDLSSAELQKNALLEQIKEVDEQEENSSKAFEVINKVQDEIMSVKFDMSDIEHKANTKFMEEKRAIQNRIDAAEDGFSVCFMEHSRIEKEIDRKKASINSNKEYKQKLVKEYYDANDMKMDEHSLVCSFCGQDLPEDKKSEVISKFEDSKKNKLEVLTNAGFDISKGIEQYEKDIFELEKQLEQIKTDKIKFNGEKSKAMDELSKLPTTVDLSVNQEYEALQSKLNNLESQIKENSSGADYRQQLRIKKSGLKEKLTVVEKLLASTSANERAEARIDELKAEQKDVAQKVANQEKGLFILEEFTKAKMNLLSSKINSKFKVVNFKLFENQINGGYKETCECTVNGVPYSGLNSAAKIQAGLDIINTLSDIYKVSAPIFIDNREGVSEIPEVDTQIINLIVPAKEIEADTVITL